MTGHETHDMATTPLSGESRRRHRRWLTDFEAMLVIDAEVMDCRIDDVSPSGARVRICGPAALAVGSELELELPGYNDLSARVRYRAGDRLGLSFLQDPDDEIELARHLIAVEPSLNLVARRADPMRE